MAERRATPFADINRTFEEVYQSLVGNGYQQEKKVSHHRTDCARSARSSHLLAVHRSSVTSKITPDITFSLSESTYILWQNLAEESTPDAQYFSSDVKRKVKCARRGMSLDPGDMTSHKDFPSPDNMDSGFQDQVDVLFDKKELSSSRSNNEGRDECNSSVDRSENVGKQLLCNSCQKLKNKVIKNKSMGIKIPKVPDPNHWCCNYWMFVKRGRNKGNTSEFVKKRSLKTTLSTIFAMKSNDLMRTQRKCCTCSTPHLFLQRAIACFLLIKQTMALQELTTGIGHPKVSVEKTWNLRLCKQAQQKVCIVRPKSQRRTSSANRSKAARPKRTVEKKEKSKQPFVFVVSSSQDDGDSGNDVERGKLKAKNKRVRFHARSPQRDLQTALPSAVTKKTSLRSETSILMPTSSRDPDCLIESPTSTKDLAASDPFPWVGSGSFRELLKHLNSGRLKSSIIKEH